MPKRRVNKFDSTYTKKKWKNRQSRRWRCVSFSYGGWWTPPTGGGRVKKAAKKDKKKQIGQYIESVMKMQYDDYNGWLDGEIYAYSDTENSIDTEWYYNYDDIPVWNCPICSYKNVERLLYCSFCNHPFHDTNINNETKENEKSNNKLNCDLIDVPISRWECSKCGIRNDQRHSECFICDEPYSNSMAYTDWTKYIQVFSYDHKNTENVTEADDGEIYKHYHDDMISKIELSRIQRKLLNILLPEKTINMLHERINDLRIGCMINDYCLKKLNLEEINEDNIIYIKEPSRWYRISKEFCTNSGNNDYSKDIEIMNDLLKYNAMIKMCDMESFLNIFLTTYDFRIFVPTDITKLCVLFCGIIPELLPFASITEDMSSVDNMNIAKFQNGSFVKFDYTHHIFQANHWLRGREQYYNRRARIRVEWEIFVGIIIGNMNHIESDCINYANFLPIFCIQRLSGHYNRNQKQKTKWSGWLSKFQARDDVAVYNDIMDTNDIIKLKRAHSPERFDSINDKRILKYVKKRDKKRYLGRKWSAYTKLETY